MNRGWTVVAGLFVILMSGSGLAFYNHSLYMSSLADAHGLPLSSVSVAVSLFFVASGLSGMLVARLMNRINVRWIMLVGTLMMAGCLAAMGQVSSLPQILVLFVVFGIGYSATSLIPSTTLVTHWFVEKRSVALAVASTGLSVGGVVLTPLSVNWVSQWGFSEATTRLALVHLLLAVPMILLLVREPAGQVRQTGAVAQPVDGLAYGSAVRSRYFIVLTAAFVLVMLSQVGGIAHQYALGAERFDTQVASTAVATLAACSITGRLLGGVLVGYLSMRAFTLGNALGQSLGLVMIAVAETPMQFWLGSAVFGLTVGNLLMLQPLLLAEAFGMKDYGRVYALSQALTTLGVAGGPALLGILHDFYSGYLAAFLVATLVSLLAFMLLVVTGARPRWATS